MHKLNPRISRSFDRVVDTYDQHAQVQGRMAERLMQTVMTTAGISFSRVFEIGCGTGLLTRQAFTHLKTEQYIANDLVPACGERVQRTISQAIEFMPGAVECLPHLPDADLILSNATLHWIRPLPELLHCLAGVVKPGGWLAVTTFGPDNFKQLNRLLELPLTYPSPEAWQAWLKPDWEVVRAEAWHDTLYFPTVLDVFRHFRVTGVNSLATPRLSKTQWQNLLEKYKRETAGAQGIPLTYHPMLWLVRRRA